MGEDAKSERLVSKTGVEGAVPSTHAISRNRRSSVRMSDLERAVEVVTRPTLDQLVEERRLNDMGYEYHSYLDGMNGVCC